MLHIKCYLNANEPNVVVIVKKELGEVESVRGPRPRNEARSAKRGGV